MHRSRSLIPVATVAVAALVALLALFPGRAIQFGDPDDGEHPYVGLLVFYNADGVPQWRCTGTLISPTVVLTAGHCTELNEGAQLFLQEDVGTVAGYPFTGGITGTAFTGPEWAGGLFLPNTGDVGVVVLDTAVTLSEYGVLADAGTLDDLQNGPFAEFEVVGYGLQSVKPVQSALRQRLKAEVSLINTESSLTDGYNVHYSGAPGYGTGGGGTCFGDSGGAVFLNGTNEIVAVNSFVLNSNCKGAGFGYRVDREPVQEWIEGFLD